MVVVEVREGEVVELVDVLVLVEVEDVVLDEVDEVVGVVELVDVEEDVVDEEDVVVVALQGQGVEGAGPVIVLAEGRLALKLPLREATYT